MSILLYDIFKYLLRGKPHFESDKPEKIEVVSAIPATNCDISLSNVLDQELTKTKPPIIDPHWSPTLPNTHFFDIHSDQASRQIAYTVSGNLDADKVLLCLPGLLETKSSFSVLHAYFLRFSECQVISIDFSGRGESDPLAEHEQYKMSVYLADISAFIEAKIFNHDKKKVRLTILGTSMGGVLAMYLAQRFSDQIYEIILNDIALTVNWTSLYALYKSMHNEIGFAEIRDLAREFSVDERVITDVQLPTHFDLSYRADVWGMNFHDALEGYKGRIGLIYGSDSKICTKRRVKEAKAHIQHLHTCEVFDAGHPAPFNLKVCSFIQEEMDVKG